MWVNTLNLHLEFDQARKTLKVFRYPSFCRLLYREVDKTLLDRLFAENVADLDETDRRGIQSTAADFLREVLLSYRLVFGQDRRSRRAVKQEFVKWKRVWESPEGRRDGGWDPLLPKLCSEASDPSGPLGLYSDVDGEDVFNYYAVTDFPVPRQKASRAPEV